MSARLTVPVHCDVIEWEGIVAAYSTTRSAVLNGMAEDRRYDAEGVRPSGHVLPGGERCATPIARRRGGAAA
jgi:hypothetical protein